MTRILKLLLFVITVFLQAGAYAEDFPSPGFSDFVLGTTTHEQVVQKMGNTGTLGDLEKNGAKMKTLKFHNFNSGRYSSAVPAEEGLSPYKTAIFYFNDGVLVGQDFFSSYKVDGTNFDESKAASIEKGKSTREEVERLLPNPSIKFIAPLIKAPSVEAIGYHYATVRRTGFGFTSQTFTSNKLLLVHFDDKNVITDVLQSKKAEK